MRVATRQPLADRPAGQRQLLSAPTPPPRSGRPPRRRSSRPGPRTMSFRNSREPSSTTASFRATRIASVLDHDRRAIDDPQRSGQPGLGGHDPSKPVSPEQLEFQSVQGVSAPAFRKLPYRQDLSSEPPTGAITRASPAPCCASRRSPCARTISSAFTAMTTHRHRRLHARDCFYERLIGASPPPGSSAANPR